MTKQHRKDYAYARALAAQQMWGVQLQVERLRVGWGAEGHSFAKSRADFEFLIGALWRLRRAVLMAQGIEPIASDIVSMVDDFDAALPVLKRLRNVGEHFDSNTIDVAPSDFLGASQQDGAFTWLGQQVRMVDAQLAAATLFRRFREVASAVGADPTLHPLEPSD